jgi:hypothetical protein
VYADLPTEEETGARLSPSASSKPSRLPA